MAEEEDYEISSVSSADLPMHEEIDEQISDNEETPAEKRLRLAKEYLEALKDDNQEEEDVDEAIAKALETQHKKDIGLLFHSISSLISKKHDYLKETLIFSYKPLTSLAIYDDILYCGSKNCSIYKYNMRTKETVEYKGLIRSRNHEFDKSFRGHRSPVIAIDVSPDGKYLASGGISEKYVHIWNTEKNELDRTLKGHRDGITSVKFQKEQPKEELILFSSSKDRSIRVWDIVSNTPMDELFGHQSDITEIDSISAKRLISCSEDLTTRLWKIPEQSQLLYSKSHIYSVDCIQYLTESLFISGAQDGRLKLWSVHKKKPIYTVIGHSGGWITSLARLENSDIIATSSEGEIKLWEMDYERLRIVRCVLKVDVKGFVNAMKFSTLEEDEEMFKFKLFAAIGSEPRLGRWKTITGVKGEVKVFEFVLNRSEVVEESDYVSTDVSSSEEEDEEMKSSEDSSSDEE